MVLLFLCPPNSGATDKSNLSRFLDLVLRRGLIYKVDENAEFIGTGLTLPEASADLTWLLPDWGSIAQELAHTHEWRADDNAVSYLRSFEFSDHDEYGYVWQWTHNKQPVYLIFYAGSASGFDVRLVLNTHDITVDEAIIAAYYDHVRSYYKPFKVEKWVIEGVDTGYLPDALDHLGSDFFYGFKSGLPFAGRIITLPYIELIAADNALWIYSSYHDKKYPLPLSFSAELDESIKAQINDPRTHVSADLKVKLDQQGAIKKVIAASVYLGDYFDRKELYKKPVPRNLPGAGALPLPDDN